jgi:hypothetical protein
VLDCHPRDRGPLRDRLRDRTEPSPISVLPRPIPRAAPVPAASPCAIRPSGRPMQAARPRSRRTVKAATVSGQATGGPKFEAGEYGNRLESCLPRRKHQPRRAIWGMPTQRTHARQWPQLPSVRRFISRSNSSILIGDSEKCVI